LTLNIAARPGVASTIPSVEDEGDLEDGFGDRLMNRVAIYIFAAMVVLSIGEGLGYLIMPP
jgi:hypothetical protein